MPDQNRGMNYDEADFLLLLQIAEDFYEWIGGERQTEIDRIWRDYQGTTIAPEAQKTES